MTVPKMILFDNGSTLTWEPEPDPLRATRAIMPHITKNPLGLDAEAILAAVQPLFREIVENIRAFTRGERRCRVE